jgi:hypothetical protein
MIGFVVFTILALGLTATVLHSLRSSQLNIMKNTAFSVAQGFAEQVKSLPEGFLLAALADPSGTPLPTRSIAATADGGTVHVDSPLFLDDPDPSPEGENYRRILIDLREDGSGRFSEVYMDMWFDIDVSRMKTSRGFLIEVGFHYRHPALSHLGIQSNTIRVVRTTGAEN